MYSPIQLLETDELEELQLEMQQRIVIANQHGDTDGAAEYDLRLVEAELATRVA